MSLIFCVTNITARSVLCLGADPGNEFRGGAHGEHGVRAYNGGLKAVPPSGARGRVLSRGTKPREAEFFELFSVQKGAIYCYFTPLCRIFKLFRNSNRVYFHQFVEIQYTVKYISCTVKSVGIIKYELFTQTVSYIVDGNIKKDKNKLQHTYS